MNLKKFAVRGLIILAVVVALCMFLSAFCACCITLAANRFTKNKEE